MVDFRKVGYSTKLVVSLRKDTGLVAGEKLEASLSQAGDGKLLVQVRRNSNGNPLWNVTTRPDELRISKKVSGRKLVPAFGAVAPESCQQVDGGWDLLLPAARPAVKRNNAKSRVIRPVEAAPPATPKPVLSSNDALKDAVRAINAHKAELGDELCLSVGTDGRLRAMVEYS